MGNIDTTVNILVPLESAEDGEQNGVLFVAITHRIMKIDSVTDLYQPHYNTEVGIICDYMCKLLSNRRVSQYLG